MPFVVEDGVGRKGANSYATVGYAKDYTETRGRDDFNGLSDAKIKSLLVRATDYIEQRWGRYYSGYKKSDCQGLSFPRLYAYDIWGNVIQGVPDEVMVASVLLAQRAKDVDRLLSDPPPPFPVKAADGTVSNSSSGEIHSETSKVGPITKTTTFAHSGLQSRDLRTSVFVGGTSAQEYPEVQQVMFPLLSGGSRSSTIRN